MHGLSKQGFYAGLFFIVSLFFPDIYLHESIPAIQCNNLLIPFFAYFIFKEIKNLTLYKYYYFFLFFALYILLTIALNKRLNSLNDFFEIYKVMKFGIVIAFYSLTPFESWKKIVIPAGIVLGALNILHFIELKPWNDFLLAYYNGGLNLVYFGKNTLMELSSKRMVGLMGSPNTNAILFSLFSFYVLPTRFNKKRFLLFLLFITLAFMCQSRTTLIGIVVAFILFFVLKFQDWNRKEVFYFIGGILLSYLISWMLCSRFFAFSIYGNSVIDGAVLQTNSVLGRLETWKFLGKMIIQNPIFGYGPNKDFFYTRNLYSENEFILYTWRYGFIGLFLYLGFYLLPLKLILKSNHNKSRIKLLILTVVLMLVTALTNNPLTDGVISVIFAIIVGYAFRQTNLESKQGIK